MKYYMMKASNYFKPFCEKCAAKRKGESFQIPNEKERKYNCFDCGENRPIESKDEVKS